MANDRPMALLARALGLAWSGACVLRWCLGLLGCVKKSAAYCVATKNMVRAMCLCQLLFQIAS